MEKLIYLEATLNILAQKDLEQTQNLVAQGTIKEIELESGAQGYKYLLITEKNNESNN
jgi:fido (protein-threonine AMPylation protein)